MNNNELKEFLVYDHKLILTSHLTNIIDYCRYLQKDYVEGTGTTSGVSCLNSLVQNGGMSAPMMISVMRAVVEYNTPYEIKFDELNG